MKNIYTVKEAAKILGFSTNTVYKYLEEGKIQAARGQEQGRYRIPKQSLEEFLGLESGTTALDSAPTPAKPPTVTFPLKLARLLIITSLGFIIFDLLTTTNFSLVQQLSRILAITIFFLLSYQYGGFQKLSDSSSTKNNSTQ